MTLIEAVSPATPQGRVQTYHRGRNLRHACGPRTRPAPPRPAGAPLRYRGTGVPTPRTPHRRRPVTAATTVGLALVAALITMWLGLVAHFGATIVGAWNDTRATVPDQLGVVRVQAGESLQQLAARVAPAAPTSQVADRIREVNDLDTVALDAGQTLIAPIG